jgi:hypothetical protein
VDAARDGVVASNLRGVTEIVTVQTQTVHKVSFRVSTDSVVTHGEEER